MGKVNYKAPVLISINTTWNLVNFRSGLIRSLIDQGYDVIVASPPDNYLERLVALGVDYRPLQIDSHGKNPGADFLLFWNYFKIFLQVRPCLFLGYTIKPNIYGSLAASLLKIPRINNVSGLGATFICNNWVTRVVKLLYRLSLRSSQRVFFQNHDDLELFLHWGLVSKHMVDTLPGSGVDLTHFKPVMKPDYNSTRPFRFLLVARLLWDKGIGEFVDAARILRRSHPNVEYYLAGFIDLNNPSAISPTQIAEWSLEGVVRYLGATDDIRQELERADCVVLPSYREGTPRSLLEAAAMAKPLITTDAPGCREVVDDGISGYLCRPKDAADLADKMSHVVSLLPTERYAMGLQGRKKVEREFDEQIVIKKYLQAIDSVLSRQQVKP